MGLTFFRRLQRYAIKDYDVWNLRTTKLKKEQKRATSYRDSRKMTVFISSFAWIPKTNGRTIMHRRDDTTRRYAKIPSLTVFGNTHANRWFSNDGPVDALFIIPRNVEEMNRDFRERRRERFGAGRKVDSSKIHSRRPAPMKQVSFLNGVTTFQKFFHR